MKYAFTLLGALLAVSAGAQPPAAPPVVKQTFAEGVEGWTGLGGIARVSRTADAKKARVEGGSVLEFEYSVDKRFLNLLMLPVTPGAWAKAGEIRFWAKADSLTPMAISVQEGGGGRWTSMFLAPKDGWQEVALSPSDFLLDRDADAPKDENGKLDVDRIENVGLLDLAQFLVRTEDAGLKTLFTIEEGPHSLLLADFAVNAAPPASPGYRLDGLNRPQVGWIPIGGMSIRRAPAANPLGSAALEIKYTVGAGKITGMVRGVPADALGAAATLSFTAAVEKSTTLLVQIEDNAGGKFNASVEIPGVKVPKKLSIALADLRRADDSKTDALDRKKVKQIVLIDPTGLTESAAQSNTLWLAGLEVK